MTMDMTNRDSKSMVIKAKVEVTANEKRKNRFCA